MKSYKIVLGVIFLTVVLSFSVVAGNGKGSNPFDLVWSAVWEMEDKMQSLEERVTELEGASNEDPSDEEPSDEEPPSGGECSPESYTVNDDDDFQIFDYWQKAQTFMPECDYGIKTIKLLIRRTGEPRDVHVDLVATNALGIPTEQTYASCVINGADIPLVNTWVGCDFSDSYEVVEDVRYAIVVSSPDTEESNMIIYRGDLSAPLYSRGQAFSKGIGSWNAWPNTDFMFETLSGL